MAAGLQATAKLRGGGIFATIYYKYAAPTGLYRPSPKSVIIR
ncbi:Uncharacterized protein dnm_033190 [Desulfonema magnum]|uniref:Uncharacterized protein n=1 Tax=Desulfonema magnum TaxID=45655 RepID=A0A975BKB2_9BACT|nr:Uncharacterized protein dnm_033190 [Desulfonema magnum]